MVGIEEFMKLNIRGSSMKQALQQQLKCQFIICYDFVHLLLSNWYQINLGLDSY